MTAWSQLWARELPARTVGIGQLMTFVKAPLTAGEYGLADALISALDSTPLTHAALVVDHDEGHPVIAHSTFGGVQVESVDKLVEHQSAPAFVFAHTMAEPETLHAAATAAASARAGLGGSPADPYPFDDILIEAILLRLRRASEFDEHRHRHLAELFDAVAPERGRGRMCAAFIAQTFANIGMPIEPPVERTAFDAGLSEVEVTDLPRWARERLTVGIVGIASGLRDRLNSIDGDDGRQPEFETVRRAVERVASSTDAAGEFVAWLTAPSGSGFADMQFAGAMSEILDATPKPRNEGLRARFTTVNDLVRSPSFRPVGHVRDWFRPD